MGRAVPTFDVMLSTPGKPESEFLRYESESQPEEGSAIFVAGRWAGILLWVFASEGG